MPTDIPIETAEIFEIRQYVDEVRRRIVLKSKLNGDPVEYLGQANGRINFPNGQVHQWAYTFKIEADSITDAFANFEKAMKEQWPARLAERQSFLAQEAATAQSRIVIAHEGQRQPGANV